MNILFVYCVCVCAYYSAVNVIFRHCTNSLGCNITVSSAWWLCFPKEWTIPLNSAHQALVNQGSSLSCLELSRTVLWLRVDPLGVVKEASQAVDLSAWDCNHDEQVEAGPEGHPPQVVLQKIAVPRLKGPKHSLDLAGPLQALVHSVHRRLEEEEEKTGGRKPVHKKWRQII